jgi:hypothetical protein
MYSSNAGLNIILQNNENSYGKISIYTATKKKVLQLQVLYILGMFLKESDFQIHS